ncbi:MAG: ATP-binding protein, partial [Tenuifilaceae bacterium]|nr:ATP-binding protein [Tenuifilaceae bacterium]
AEQKAISITSTLPLGIQVFADKAMLSIVIRNLISNAIKFTQPHGQITIASAIKHNELTVSVIDNGVGIPKEDIDKLFKIDTVYTTRGTQEEKGTGLGLILCKEFIKKNKGRIWVESTDKMGSIFSFSLPLNQEC